MDWESPYITNWIDEDGDTGTLLTGTQYTQLTVENDGGDAIVFVTREDARQIVLHLVTVFDLSVGKVTIPAHVEVEVK